eukprot:384893-Hanusia_phi.AAC.1
MKRKPSLKGSNCELTEEERRYSTYRCTYSLLLLLVTSTSPPPSFSSTNFLSPNDSIAAWNVRQKTSCTSPGPEYSRRARRPRLVSGLRSATSWWLRGRENSEAEEQANEHELLRGLERGRVEPQHTRLLLLHEHAEGWIEELLHDEREELLLQPPLVHPFLPDERHLERLEQVALLLPAQLVQRVLQQVRPAKSDDAEGRVRRRDAAAAGRWEAVPFLHSRYPAPFVPQQAPDRRLLLQGERPGGNADELLLLLPVAGLDLEQLRLGLVSEEEGEAAEAEVCAPKRVGGDGAAEKLLGSSPGDVVKVPVNVLGDERVVELARIQTWRVHSLEGVGLVRQLQDDDEVLEGGVDLLGRLDLLAQEVVEGQNDARS